LKHPGSRPGRASRAVRGPQSRELRIIAGRWRGRRWRFPADSPIRPTPDRVRETLFNWLQGRVEGAHCLDLFAGSGALGLEALSRGASSVVFVDNDALAVQGLRTLLIEWAGEGGEVLRSDAARYLAQSPRAFDLVFLDPPFEARLLDGVCARLVEGGWLAQGACIYIEHARHDAPPALPGGWRALRSGSAGEVSYHLHEHGSS